VLATSANRRPGGASGSRSDRARRVGARLTRTREISASKVYAAPKLPEFQCRLFGYDPVPRCAAGAADHTIESGGGRTSPQPEFRSWRRRPTAAQAAPAGRALIELGVSSMGMQFVLAGMKVFFHA
jgi:hypothetical protein